MNTQLFELCKQLGLNLSKEAITDLNKITFTKHCKKGENLLSEGEYCTKIFFIGKGLIKNGYWKENREYIIRFCEENCIFTDLESIYTKTPSKFFLTAIEETHSIYMNIDDYEKLLGKHHDIQKATRICHEKKLIKAIGWNKEILGCDAQEIYLKFKEDQPKLFNRISLGDLSSHLGISQASLSRIRSSLAKSKN